MQLPEALLDHQSAVEQALHDVMDRSSHDPLPLYRMMQYQLGWVDKDGADEVGPRPDRLHGAFCLEAASSVGGPAPGPAAAAAELIHESVTVHEEMQSGEYDAAARPPVWWNWGPAQAINVGDGLHALARLAVLRLQRDGLSPEQTLGAVAGLDETALKFYEGQFLDLTFQERIDVQESQYLHMAEAKAGALLGGVAALGAHAAGADARTTGAFRAFGERLGLAAQICDDVLQLWDRDARQKGGGRVLNKSKLFPVVHALEAGSIPQKRALGEVYFKRVMEPGDLAAVRAVLDEVGARGYAEDRARGFAAEALALLGSAGMSDVAMGRWGEIVGALVPV